MADGMVRVVMVEEVVREVEFDMDEFAEMIGCTPEEVPKILANADDSDYGVEGASDLLEAMLTLEHGEYAVNEREWTFTIEGVLSPDAKKVQAVTYAPEWED